MKATALAAALAMFAASSPSIVLGGTGTTLAVDEDDRWSPDFGNPFPVAGVDGTVNCALVHDGALVLGGRFRISGHMEMVNIARLEGSSWTTVGGGTDGAVHALGTFRGDLVAAGDFRIAQWNGYAWRLLGEGVEGRVSVLLEYQDLLLVAGRLTRAGGSPSGPIAAWDGESWRPFSEGLDGDVTGLAMHDGRLVAAGSFSVNGAPMTVARWDGAAWEAFGDDSLPGAVTALLSRDGVLFTGGGQVHQWNGTGWTNLGGPGAGSVVEALAAHDGRLLAGGFYPPSNAPMVATLAQWDGTSWTSLGHDAAWGSLIDTAVFDLCEFDGRLIVAGLFQGTGDLAAGSVAGWDDGEWSTLGEPPPAGSGMDAIVRALLPFDGRLIAAGEFRRAGALRTRNIAAWDGSRWDSLGPGLTSSVSALADFHGSLVASSYRDIEMWDGRAWSRIGWCEDGAAWALSVFQGDLIAAGTFNSIDGVPARNIARWDGSGWTPLGEGIGSLYTAQIYCLAVADSSLYVGGTFWEAGGIPAEGLARWDGESWSEVGSGERGSVLAMIVNVGELVVSRSETLRTWNGRRWATLTQADDAVLSLAVHDSLLIAGGGFSLIGDVEAHGIAAWDGVEWAALGSGVVWRVEAIATFDRDLYVGGNFRFAGGKASYHIGRWKGGTGPAPGQVLAMRNPYRPGDPIQIDLEGSATVSLDVHDLQGRRVQTLWSGTAVGPVIVQWDGSSTGGSPAPRGIYFLHGHAGARPIRSKVLLLHP